MIPRLPSRVACPDGLAFPLSASGDSGICGKPPMRSSRSAGCFHAAQGDEPQIPPNFASPAIAGDECPISFESASRRLARTGANLRPLSNVHLPALAGNVRFQFVTWLPTDETMRLTNLWMQVQKKIKSVDFTKVSANGFDKWI
jgi:hypothetical protein